MASLEIRPVDQAALLPGVGVKRAQRLSALKIETVGDLLRHYPVRYEDRRSIRSIAEVRDGETALISARVTRVSVPPFAARGGSGTGPPMRLWVTDDSGVLTILFFSHRYLRNTFIEGGRYLFYGTVRVSLNGVSMAHPDFEKIDESADGEAVKAAGLVPVYALTAGVTQKMLRNLIGYAIPAADAEGEMLPSRIVTARHLAPPSYALRNIHFPENEHALKSARYRLIYEELFLLQAGLFLLRNRGSRLGTRDDSDGARDDGCVSLRPPRRNPTIDNVRDEFARLLPYSLTGAQERAIAEIFADMQETRPMARLLQGDVGSGKTAVAMAAALLAGRRGTQTLYMAPTEILAIQQATEFARVFAQTGLKVACLTSGLKTAGKTAIKEALAAGEIDILVGTHALIEDDVLPSRLGLAVTDEQHRFGVAQRLRLQEKGHRRGDGSDSAVNVLVMTATPIPRTLAMLLYGDLDASALDEMPPGRKPIQTRLAGSDKRDAAYDFAEKVMAKGHQVYVIASMIDERDTDDGLRVAFFPPTSVDNGKTDSEANAESGGESKANVGARNDIGGGPGDDGFALKTVAGLAEELAARFPQRRIGVLHGRMKPAEKDAAMTRFVSGQIDLLVSTTVVEVGVNVPNATLMIIENAERFGLAQLHQLRGRVGRGADKSYCVLISDSGSELAVKRGKALEQTGDGFQIAEMDLLLRGPGDLFGVRQHGLPEMKIADPARHIGVVREAGEDVKVLFAQDPLLEAPEHAALRAKLDGTLLGR